MKYFFSSISDKAVGAGNILVQAAMKNEERISGYKMDIVTPYKIYKRRVRFIHLIVVLRFLLSGSLRGVKACSLIYENVRIGRQCVSTALRSPVAYKSKFRYYMRLIKAVLQAFCMVDDFHKFYEKVAAVFVRDPSYLSGIYIELAINFNLPVYHFTYPYSLTRFIVHRVVSSSELFDVYPSYDPDLDKGKDIMKRILVDTNNISYMSGASFVEVEQQYADVDVIVYAHSFTDAQQIREGDDCFLSVYDWLIYTLKNLKGKRVILKAHPSFFRIDWLSKVSQWDYEIFESIKSWVEQLGNVIIIDKSVRNIDLLKAVSKDVVLISHHGNALLEGAYMGFRCVCSYAAPWKRYGLFEYWRTKDEYIKILNDIDNVSFSNKRSVYHYMYDLYYGSGSFFSEKGWQNICESISGISKQQQSSNPLLISSLPESVKGNICNVISRNIPSVNVEASSE